MDAVRGQAHLEKQKAFEASKLGQAYKAGKFVGETVLDKYIAAKEILLAMGG